MKNLRLDRVAVFICAMALLGNGYAATITSSLGNTSSGLIDGQTTTLIGDLLPAQSGQPAPFNSGYGSDPLLNSVFDKTYTHSYGLITDPILSASITIGIADHDSAGAGSQLAAFTLDGNSFTSVLNSMFESDLSDNMVYNLYTVALTGPVLANLTDGILDVVLTLSPPGRDSVSQDTVGNGAFLLFSTLAIETRDQSGGGGGPPGGGGSGAPEPGTLLLFALGAVGFSASRRRRGERWSF